MTLPTPDPAFRWSVETWGHALRCRPLESVAQHVFTTRQLALRIDPGAWAQAAASVGASVGDVRRVRQVHGAAVRVLRRKDSNDAAADAGELPAADALVTDVEGLVLAVQVADCVPILMADPYTGAVGAVHAGWRGTAAGVARAAIDAMTREFGTAPQDLIVALGPSIGTCCYEVGAELIDAFGAAFDETHIARWFTRDAAGSLRLDVAMANIDQLQTAGVPRDQIYAASLCTQTHADIFDSFRADGVAVGRMAALIRCRGDRPRL